MFIEKFLYFNISGKWTAHWAVAPNSYCVFCKYSPAHNENIHSLANTLLIINHHNKSKYHVSNINWILIQTFFFKYKNCTWIAAKTSRNLIFSLKIDYLSIISNCSKDKCQWIWFFCHVFVFLIPASFLRDREAFLCDREVRSLWVLSLTFEMEFHQNMSSLHHLATNSMYTESH